mmetsp:Transcript_2648/g.10105  ORF Transcript_2648/g.10105 Transcript_2648/m.10105 type:complete len:113 (-) Transcript_2648:8054-8392(-)
MSASRTLTSTITLSMHTRPFLRPKSIRLEDTWTMETPQSVSKAIFLRKTKKMQQQIKRKGSKSLSPLSLFYILNEKECTDSKYISEKDLQIMNGLKQKCHHVLGEQVATLLF